MSRNFNKSVSGMVVLIALGMLALYAGPKSLVLVLPAAGLLWWSAEQRPRSDRN